MTVLWVILGLLALVLVLLGAVTVRFVSLRRKAYQIGRAHV